jgi:GT2 family glycosyltransferase
MATHAEPTVAIVLCTRNRAERLGAALDALTKIESRHPWEVLVVDNASVDHTEEVIAGGNRCDGRLRTVRVERVGLGAARDAAWRETRAPIVAFTDDDCYVQPDFVDSLVEAFRDYPEAGCIGGRILLHDPEDARVTIDEREHPVAFPPHRFLPAGSLMGANLAFRRKTLERIGGFDRDLGAGTRFPCEDIDAAAAAVWAGFYARFDPRPVVFHHHGRREAEIDRLDIGYDRGRGAYYAKYILRPDSRAAYARAWVALTSESYNRRTLVRLSREVAAAALYLAHCKRYGFLLAAAPITICMAVVALLRGLCIVAARHFVARSLPVVAP